MWFKLLLFVATLWLSLLCIQKVNLIKEIFSLCGLFLITPIFAWQIVNLLLKYVVVKKSLLPTVDPKNKAVLITGCDSGFGHLTAITLNKHGFKVFACCLLPNGEGAKRLQRDAFAPEKMILINLDVTKEEDMDKVYQVVNQKLEDKEELWGLVNNAGIGVGGQVEWGSFESQFGQVFDINVFGVVKMTRKFLPLIRQSKGRIVNVASVAGRTSLPCCTAYNMTKHAVVALNNGLRREMSKFGVHVVSIEPSFYATTICDTATDALRRLWDTSSEEIQLTYTEKFYNQVLKSTATTLKTFVMEKNPQEVADTIMESLVSKVKEPNYLIASPHLKLFWRILFLLPSEFEDIIYSIFPN